MDRLQLKPRGFTRLAGFAKGSNSSKQAPLVYVNFNFSDHGIQLPDWEKLVAAVPLMKKDNVELALLGRDFLRDHMLVYEGREGRIQLGRYKDD